MMFPDDSRHENFLRLYTASEGSLRAFVRSLVPTIADANEVMQDVGLVLWQKFGEYGDGEDFRRWAFCVAKYKVLAWQRDRQRDRHLFGEEFLEFLSQDAASRSDLITAGEAAALCGLAVVQLTTGRSTASKGHRRHQRSWSESPNLRSVLEKSAHCPGFLQAAKFLPSKPGPVR